VPSLDVPAHLQVLDHGVDMTVVTFSAVLFADSTGFFAAHPDFSFVVYAAMMMAQFMNNWYHSVTGQMSWGGRYISIDEGLLMNIAIIAYRYINPETPAFKATVFTVPAEYQGYLAGFDVMEADNSVNVLTMIGIGIVAAALQDCASKLYDSVEVASAQGKLGKALQDLAPVVLYQLCYWRFLQEATSMPAFLMLAGAIFATIGCRLVFLSTCDSRTLAVHQHISMLVSFSLFFVQDQVKAMLLSALSPVLAGSPALGVVETYGASLVAWTIFAFGFVAGIREINAAKGGGSMFVIVPKISKD
jgi:hypothetical protein